MKALAPLLQAMIGHMDEDERPPVENIVAHDIPESLAFIDSATLHMKKLLDAILKLSRLGRSPLHLEPIDMNALVGQVLESMAYSIEKGEVEIDVGKLPNVIADRTAMEQIMSNALSNAVLYLDPARRGRITITGENGEKETFFHISDNGRGILKENIQKIWTPFRRGSHTDIEGDGMGLVYMQTLVSRHNGNIHLESVHKEGTTLTFSVARTGESE
jgi:light-regulated signal transduction histidine kinase (bacteriophytochrome)